MAEDVASNVDETENNATTDTRARAIVVKGGGLKKDSIWTKIRLKCYDITYLQWHIVYFIILSFVGSGLLLISTGQDLAYLDALFMSVSIVTTTGLSTVPMEGFNTYQQIVMFILMVLGSIIWVSQYSVWARLVYFQRALDFCEKNYDKIAKGAENIEQHGPIPPEIVDLAVQERTLAPPGWPFNYQNYVLDPMEETVKKSTFSDIAIQATDDDLSRKSAEDTTISIPDNHLRRRFAFVDPSKTYREAAEELPPELKGALHPNLYKTYQNLSQLRSQTSPSFVQVIQTKYAIPERNALILLAILIPVYMIFWVFVASIVVWIWLAFPSNYNFFISSINPPINPWWYSLFLMNSAFTNVGLTLVTPSSQVLVEGAGPYLYVMVWLIVAGNTLAPPFLRFAVLVLTYFEKLRLKRYKQSDAPGAHTTTPKTSSRFLDACEFLLQHPRRVYTLMFDSVTTRWVFFSNMFITLLGTALFVGFQWNNYTDLGFSQRNWNFWLDGFAQQTSDRSAGITIFDLYALNPALWIWTMVVMYIAVFPVSMARKRTNVYVDRAMDEGDDRRFEIAPDGSVKWITDKKGLKNSYVMSQIRSQVFSELAFVGVAMFLLVASESYNVKDDARLNIFYLTFEVISAFGTVGLSLGPPNAPSLSAILQPFSKVVIMLVMMVGRHRGMPSRIDKSVNIPGMAELEEAGGLWLAMSDGAAEDAQSERMSNKSTKNDPKE